MKDIYITDPLPIKTTLIKSFEKSIQNPLERFKKEIINNDFWESRLPLYSVRFLLLLLFHIIIILIAFLLIFRDIDI